MRDQTLFQKLLRDLFYGSIQSLQSLRGFAKILLLLSEVGSNPVHTEIPPRTEAEFPERLQTKRSVAAAAQAQQVPDRRWSLASKDGFLIRAEADGFFCTPPDLPSLPKRCDQRA